MKSLFLASLVVLGLTYALLSQAQEDATSVTSDSPAATTATTLPPATTTKAKNPKDTTKTIYPENQTIDFEGLSLEGELKAPGEFYFQNRNQERFDTLTKRRLNFRREMLRDAVQSN